MTNHPNRSTTQWIDGDYDTHVGQFGFLVRTEHNLKGWTRYSINDTPAHGNQSHQPHLHGWCGTTNDVAVYAMGMAKIEQIAKNGRAKVRLLKGADLDSAITELGYPELAE